MKTGAPSLCRGTGLVRALASRMDGEVGAGHRLPGRREPLEAYDEVGVQAAHHENPLHVGPI